ncbi:MAG: hypothetical protein V3R73_05735 [Sphingomonadales bacterium]
MRSLLFTASFLAVALSAAPIAYAQVKEAAPQAGSPATDYARLTGALAGTAAYCKIDANDRELYINRAQAKIALSARDEVELVVAKIAFSNELNHASVLEPESGCKEFRNRFKALLAEAN